MRENVQPALQVSTTGTISYFRDKVNRAAGRRAGASFFARRLDYFIMTKNSQSLPGLGAVKTVYHDPKLIVHLPGLAKNAAPRH